MFNSLRTAALMAVLIVLFAVVGRALAGPDGMLIAFGVAVAMNFAGYWFSDKIVLRMYRAQEIGRALCPLGHGVHAPFGGIDGAHRRIEAAHHELRKGLASAQTLLRHHVDPLVDDPGIGV